MRVVRGPSNQHDFRARGQRRRAAPAKTEHRIDDEPAYPRHVSPGPETTRKPSATPTSRSTGTQSMFAETIGPKTLAADPV